MYNRRVPLFRLALCLPLAIETGQPTAKPVEIVVSTGLFDRRNTPVMVRFDRAPAVRRWELVDERGAALPLQMRDERHGLFVLPDLKANQTRVYTLRPAMGDERAQTRVAAVKEGDTIVMTIAGKPAFTYQGATTQPPAGYASSYGRGGYIYPVLTPAGANVADDYPPNHKHHHGIWAAWTKTQFEGRHPDFWNMGDRTGTVEPVDVGAEFSGPVCGGFVARHRYIDLSAKPPKDVLNETWNVVAYASGTAAAAAGAGAPRPYFVFDLTVTQTCSTASPLVLEEYRYGGLAFRGAREWNGGGEEACQWLTSEGKGRIDGNEAPSRWVRLSAKVAGRPASVAILDHPQDFRFPQPIRIFPDQPYCVYSPSQLGRFEIAPGKPFVERYRFIVPDGVLEPAELDQLWNDYAHPPHVEVK